MPTVIDPVVDSDGGVAAGHSLHPTSLGFRPGWIHTSVLSVRDPEVHVVRLGIDALNGLDSVRDVGVVDEPAAPIGEALSIRDTR